MSISLAALRLELAENGSTLTSFRYTAPNSSVGAPTYAEAVSSVKTTKNTENIIDYRGRREYQLITIDTYNSAVSADEFCNMADGITVASTGEHCEEAQVEDEVFCESPPPDGLSERLTEVDKNTEDSRKSHSEDERTSIPPSKSPSPQSTASGEESLSTRKRVARRDQNFLKYFSGNPTVESTEGILHLYKNSTRTSLTEEVSRSEMICILNVPASMMTQDLLQYLAPVQPYIEIIKILRDTSPNQYMVLLKFRNQVSVPRFRLSAIMEKKYADEFFKSFNNVPFNSFESDICHLVYIAKLEALSSSEGAGLAVSGLTELPVCPVCLERMDESVDGILTILCNHSFHSSCLAQWGDTSCPVCRYVQTPEYSANNRCFQCDSPESLWICLICGHVGCGRYAGAHAFRHFEDTNHTYSMQVGTNNVWDYAGDNYVHRLVANKGDGKIVQVDEGGNLVQEEKLDSITLEYTYLLTNQLESQRLYFEEKMEKIEQAAQKEVQDMELKSKKALEECQVLDRKLASAVKDKLSTDKRYSQIHDRLAKVLSELTDEREMNKSLRDNQCQWQDKVTKMETSLKEKENEIKEVKEQLRDVMFYLEAQQKLSSTSDVSQEELQEGKIVVGASGGKKSSRKKGK